MNPDRTSKTVILTYFTGLNFRVKIAAEKAGANCIFKPA